jgi:hypothetical protein
VDAFNGARARTAPVARPQPYSPNWEWLARLPHRESLELNAQETAPRAARRLVARLLPQWSLSQFEVVTSLIATELVTNALVATREAAWAATMPPVRLWLCGGPSVVTVLAWDATVDPPMLRDADEDDESGRGLAIVAALSAHWGYYYPAEFGGKVTWSIIATP